MAALERITVLVCHEDLLWQAGVAATLARCADIECAEADASAPACPTANVIVADYGRGLAFAAAREGPRVIVVTPVDRVREVRAALARGVRGYLPLGCAPAEVIAAVRAVHRGEHVLGPTIASRLAENLAMTPLTQREAAVLRLVVEGLGNKAIAARLDITASTVKSHLGSTFGKIGGMSRTQAIAIAQRRGLIES